MGTPVLELENINTYYGKIHALKGVSLTVERGEVVTLIGSNGAGKTTTLRTISGLLHPKQGDIKLNGSSITTISPNKIVEKGIGHVPEGRGVFPALTVFENLEMGAFLPVSYTHLRAHETVLDLVCRLLLAKKQKQENQTVLDNTVCH